MKKLFFLLIFLLSVAAASAQQDRILYVVDGVPTDSLTISAEDIEEIYVLRDKQQIGCRPIKDVIIIVTKGSKVYHEATVLDAGFDSFVATQKGIDYYSSDYLKNKNRTLVNEWNSRCNQPMKYNPEIYEATIDYDPKTNYGKDVEYTLYMFFRFMEAKHGNLFNSLAKL
ncbi:DUF6146 family protein [Dysgonomonas sp. 25]|uniref:DUF6146 family protein n=1 Tax=Dysgonomonas sp. 25 TaxID=2302933 RepID=UPI0013D1401C|nr:DUF6146 family protein [Dysgonomonas sp. 25]NDV68717.1 hypothetical protein [Dysgonomonas sp. 25]